MPPSMTFGPKPVVVPVAPAVPSRIPSAGQKSQSQIPSSAQFPDCDPAIQAASDKVTRLTLEAYSASQTDAFNRGMGQVESAKKELASLVARRMGGGGGGAHHDY